jgi:peroxiredoxin
VRRIAQLRDRFEELQRHGLDVIVVLCQKRAAVAAWLVKRPIPFPILIDQDRSRAKRWGVYTLLSYDAIHLARPAAFVVDPAGILRYARISRHQLDPAPIEEILAAAPQRS